MNCDRLAPYYQVIEACTAGRKLQRCRLAFLEKIPEPKRILLAGEGHGRFLVACARRFPDAQILVVDSSEVMLRHAKSLVNSECIEFLHLDLCQWQGPREPFDLIVTHFFLDCFTAEELTKIIGKLSAWATPDAHWLLADFQIPKGKAAALRSRMILALLYTFFRIVSGLKTQSLASPDLELQKNDFSCHRRIILDWGLLKSEWWRREPREGF